MASKFMIKVMLVSHRGERCGVQQYGRALHSTLEASGALRVSYRECASEKEFLAALEDVGPEIVIFNYYPTTLPWLTSEVTRRVSVPTFGIAHELTQELADGLKGEMFDFYLSLDPALMPCNPIVLPVPRFIPDPIELPRAPPRVFTVGSFGFGTPGKGFDRLCRIVNEQCDKAVIRINIPPHDDPRLILPEWVTKIEEACRSEIRKPGITLVLTKQFMGADELVSFLSSNTINAFLYDHEGKGISSCTDYALAAGRPIAISRSGMFRHLLPVNPSICVEDLSLMQIAENGFAPLLPLQRYYRRDRSGTVWARAIEEALNRRAFSLAVPDGRGFNKILDDRSRAAYRETIRDLEKRAPELIKRKIPQANIQQAFALDAVERFAREKPGARILAVGAAEDTAVEVLCAKGYRVDAIDPGINVDLSDFYLSMEGVPESYDIILCVSVLEHVQDDELFVRHVAELLAPGGIAVFTVDFRDDYVEGTPRPSVDFRLYSSRDLLERLMPLILDCALVDRPLWRDGAPEFEHDGAIYNFATWVFRKLPAPWRQYRGERFVNARTTPWKNQLVVEFPKGISAQTKSNTFFPEYPPRYGSVRLLTDIVTAQEQRLSQQEQQLAQQDQALVERQRQQESLRVHLDKATGAIESVRVQLTQGLPSVGHSQEAGPGKTPRELLSLHGREFVENTYRTLLGRMPDQSGLEFHVESLRRGASRLNLIKGIRYSPEGRSAGVDVGSIGFELFLARLYALPLLFGRLIREVAGLVGLAGETTSRRAREIEAIEELNRNRTERKNLHDKLIRVEGEIVRYQRNLSASELRDGHRQASTPASIQSPLPTHNSSDQPLLSLCITTYNRSPWLQRSLDNILPQLSDLQHLVELVVCDNASTDGTERLMGEYRGHPVIRYYRNRANVGMLGNLGVTADHARGKFVWILGDDDILLNGVVGPLLKAIVAFSDIELAYMNYSYTHVADPAAMSHDELLKTQAPISQPSPDRYVTHLREIAGNTENFFTAIYCCVFRADHAKACFNQDTRGRPFSSLLTCVPTTHYVLNNLLDRPAFWLGSPAVLVNMNVSWLKYADLWLLERFPEMYERFQKEGVAPVQIDRYRKNSLPGIMHYLESYVAQNSGNLDIIDLACLFRTYRHLDEFQALLPEIKRIIRTKPDFAARVKFDALED